MTLNHSIQIGEVLVIKNDHENLHSGTAAASCKRSWWLEAWRTRATFCWSGREWRQLPASFRWNKKNLMNKREAEKRVQLREVKFGSNFWPSWWGSQENEMKSRLTTWAHFSVIGKRSLALIEKQLPLGSFDDGNNWRLADWHNSQQSIKLTVRSRVQNRHHCNSLVLRITLVINDLLGLAL